MFNKVPHHEDMPIVLLIPMPWRCIGGVEV